MPRGRPKKNNDAADALLTEQGAAAEKAKKEARQGLLAPVDVRELQLRSEKSKLAASKEAPPVKSKAELQAEQEGAEKAAELERKAAEAVDGD